MPYLAQSVRPELPVLTSLRFFAALWVVLFHIREIGLWTGGPAPYVATIQLGYLGVSFFFVLSGFILVYVYSGRAVSKRRFWQARFARVYPAYLFSLLVTLPLALSFMLPLMRRAHVAPAFVFTVFPLLLEAWFPRSLYFWNPVAWSLSVEAFFYLVFPFAIGRLTRLSRRGLLLWTAAAWLASLAITGGYLLLRPDGVAHTSSADNQLFWLSAVKFNPLARLPEFLLGMATGALFLRTPPGVRNRPTLAGLGLLLAAIALQRWLPYPMLHTGLLGPAFALLLFGLATGPAWSRPLASRPLLLLGEASYSLYLLHTIPIAILAFPMHLAGSPHALGIVAVYLVVMLLVSVAVYTGIENPLRRLLRPSKLPQPVPAVAVLDLAPAVLKPALPVGATHTAKFPHAGNTKSPAAYRSAPAP